MMLAEDVANAQIGDIAARLSGGRSIVFDDAGNELVSCAFAEVAFQPAKDGKASANPMKTGIATADGAPSSFEAYDRNDQIVLAGSAGHRDADPKPEMRFKVRQIVQDADVDIESFEISIQNIINVALLGESGANP